jgi:hypothetical protein
MYGLPTTADLDKYLAFHKLLEQIRNRVGEISNPVGFTSTQLLTVLGIKRCGDYQDTHKLLAGRGKPYRRNRWQSQGAPRFVPNERMPTMPSSSITRLPK